MTVKVRTVKKDVSLIDLAKPDSKRDKGASAPFRLP
jgi:hypothetical protein